jgi:hypothetical protein
LLGVVTYIAYGKGLEEEVSSGETKRLDYRGSIGKGRRGGK